MSSKASALRLQVESALTARVSSSLPVSRTPDCGYCAGRDRFGRHGYWRTSSRKFDGNLWAAVLGKNQLADFRTGVENRGVGSMRPGGCARRVRSALRGGSGREIGTTALGALPQHRSGPSVHRSAHSGGRLRFDCFRFGRHSAAYCPLRSSSSVVSLPPSRGVNSHDPCSSGAGIECQDMRFSGSGASRTENALVANIRKRGRGLFATFTGMPAWRVEEPCGNHSFFVEAKKPGVDFAGPSFFRYMRRRRRF